MCHPDVPAHLRGTYAGLATAPVIEYLTRLGVTSIELMPVHSFVDDRNSWSAVCATIGVITPSDFLRSSLVTWRPTPSANSRPWSRPCTQRGWK
jgi:hypothetical protein